MVSPAEKDNGSKEEFGLQTMVCMALLSITLSAPTATITGEDWSGFNKLARKAYIVGLIDAWMTGAALADHSRYARIASCVQSRNKTYEEIAVLAKRILETHPEQAHTAMALAAVGRACGEYE